jgi:hypothetical protein
VTLRSPERGARGGSRQELGRRRRRRRKPPPAPPPPRRHGPESRPSAEGPGRGARIRPPALRPPGQSPPPALRAAPGAPRAHPGTRRPPRALPESPRAAPSRGFGGRPRGIVAAAHPSLALSLGGRARAAPAGGLAGGLRRRRPDPARRAHGATAPGRAGSSARTARASAGSMARGPRRGRWERAVGAGAPLCACAARQAAASPSSASRRHSRPAGPWPGLHCASEASRCSIPDLERRSGLPTLLVLTPNYSGDGRGRRVACLPCSRYVYALEGKVSQHVLLPRTPFQASLPRPSLERQKAWEGNLNAEMLLGTGRLE